MTSIFTSARISNAVAILAAGAALSFAVPANAAPETSARNTSAERNNNSAARSSTRRICVDQTGTGTRISTRVCRTAAEWQNIEGYVPR
jgi:hypothetical protein